MHGILEHEPFASRLAEIDAIISETAADDIPSLWHRVPLDVFAVATCTKQARFPNIRDHSPRMPSEERERNWVGNSGEALLCQSVAFVRTAVQLYEKHGAGQIQDASVLDYGVGWGRLIRLFNRYVPRSRLFGVDAWPAILKECQSLGVQANLGEIKQYATALPFPDAKFDLIFAFSIFTHLSQRAALAAARVCSAALSDRGLFIATIRPKSIIADLRENAARMLADYEDKGFAFLSNSSLTPIDGDIPYGVAVVSVDYMARNWPFLEVVDVEFDLIDPMQIRVAFRKSTSVRE